MQGLSRPCTIYVIFFMTWMLSSNIVAEIIIMFARLVNDAHHDVSLKPVEADELAPARTHVNRDYLLHLKAAAIFSLLNHVVKHYRHQLRNLLWWKFIPRGSEHVGKQSASPSAVSLEVVLA